MEGIKEAFLCFWSFYYLFHCITFTYSYFKENYNSNDVYNIFSN